MHTCCIKIKSFDCLLLDGDFCSYSLSPNYMLRKIVMVRFFIPTIKKLRQNKISKKKVISITRSSLRNNISFQFMNKFVGRKTIAHLARLPDTNIFVPPEAGPGNCLRYV